MRLFLAIPTVVNALCGSYLLYTVPDMTADGRRMTLLGVLLAPAALLLMTGFKEKKR